MFIGIRDMLHAKGRFALVTSVIVLMTLLVVVLSALTAGLTNQSISAITRLPGSEVVMQKTGDQSTPTFTESALDAETVNQIVAANPGASALGITTSRISAGSTTVTATLFGSDATLMPTPSAGTLPTYAGVMLSPDQATALGVTVGDVVSVGGRSVSVTGIGETGSFAHTAVAYLDLATWRDLAQGQYASAVILDRPHAADSWQRTDLEVLAMTSAPSAVPGYTSENGSLLAIQAMLVAVSALVVGAFFTVWTFQRMPDLAVTRALGASRAYLVRDGLSQVIAILLLGQIIGLALGVGIAAAAAGTVPIALSVGVALPLLAMSALGLLGSLFAIRRMTVVDPLTALS